MDLSHTWSGDLDLTVSGRLALSDGDTLTKQRIMRRLMTNPGDYHWHLNYGAGLPRFIGEPVHPSAIQALVKSQILLEASAAKSPPPVVKVSASQDGTVFLDIIYYSATGLPQNLSFGVRGTA